jgi:hypothetical protein
MIGLAFVLVEPPHFCHWKFFLISALVTMTVTLIVFQQTFINLLLNNIYNNGINCQRSYGLL